eukprot:5737176-Pyramimonas_sp.AAC.1
MPCDGSSLLRVHWPSLASALEGALGPPLSRCPSWTGAWTGDRGSLLRGCGTGEEEEEEEVEEEEEAKGLREGLL